MNAARGGLLRAGHIQLLPGACSM
eukprot:SAG31_NODE_6256_length_2101_cov_1.600400_1_plen_23_part_10